jgi:hypothetical protein
MAARTTGVDIAVSGGNLNEGLDASKRCALRVELESHRRRVQSLHSRFLLQGRHVRASIVKRGKVFGVEVESHRGQSAVTALAVLPLSG